MKTTAIRYHDICMGHRVVGHEGKCKNLHGHNYRFHFTVAPEGNLDEIGRVLDFSIIKEKLCNWLEENWDHKFMVYVEDPMLPMLHDLNSEGIRVVPFNPTAENIARFFIETVSPQLLEKTGCKLILLKLEETRKCSVEVSL